MNKILLYFNTIKFLKPSQIYFRIKKMLGLQCSLRYNVGELEGKNIRPISPIKELDYDSEFLNRFDVNSIMKDTVTFLHSERKIFWNKVWDYEDQSPLWNFNLHYFEYLFPLIKAYKETGEYKYFDKTKECILAWIYNNPSSNGGSGWSSYTIALRLTIWLDYYTEMEIEIKRDKEFCHQLITSMYEQYTFLSKHLEKDLMGNHYFEDLKTLVLCSIFFKDDNYFRHILKEFKNQCKEQILNDGMHYELSPMYHKIILEDILRVAYELKSINSPDKEIESYIQPMLDVAYSLEKGIDRIPLFNDCGNNVSKSLDSLVITAKKYFNISPIYKNSFPESGYYIFENCNWKLVVFAGQPGPKYIPAHSHCDAMSFELFKNGIPQLVNCGTYAYQCQERQFFRGTSSHNTVMADSTEQFCYWGTFRVANRSSVTVLKRSSTSIIMKLVDQKKHHIIREISFTGSSMEVKDTCKGSWLSAFYHIAPKSSISGISMQGHNIKSETHLDDYAYDFGMEEKIKTLKFEHKDMINISVELV